MSKPLRISRELEAATQRHLRELGAGRREAVVLWIGTWPPSSVQRLVVPSQQQAYDRFVVPLAERVALAQELSDAGEAILAQVHTHPGHAFHSVVDDREAIPRRRGSFSLVVPAFARRNDLLDGAALYRLEAGGTWRAVNLSEWLVIEE